MKKYGYKQDVTIFSFNYTPLKSVDQFLYLHTNIASTESDANIRIGKAWTNINTLVTKMKLDLSKRIKQEFLHVTVSEQWYVWLYHLDSHKMNGKN